MDMLNDFIRKNSTLLFVILLGVIALIGFSTYASISNQGMHSVPLSAVPADAEVLINGVKTKLGDSTTLPEGTHTISISKEGYATLNKKLVIEKDTDVSSIAPFALSPVSDDAKKWAEENEELYGEFPNVKTNIDPVFAYIPSTTLLYSVTSDSTSAPVTIKASSLGLYKNGPIDYLKRSGIDPSDYVYTFNYTNPFKAVRGE